MSVGLDRLMAALTHLGAVAPVKTTVQALIVSLGKVPAHEVLHIANELRAAGINTEAYFGKKNRMKDQLSHADHYEIPVAVIVGEDELARGEVSVKDLRAGKAQREDIGDRDAYRQAGTAAQVTVARKDLVATVRRMLTGGAS
jgi:histidyl-tRNA synthetase